MIRSIKRVLAWRKDFYYDKDAAQRVIRFFHNNLVHNVGKLAGAPFILERWQRKIVNHLFGWKRREDGTRKHRSLFLFVPRKNGKSTFGAGLALYLLHADGEIGAEIVSAAADADQANILFTIAKDMNDASPLLAERAKSFRRSLVVYKSGSNYKVISSIAGTKHGQNLHGVLFDELHVQNDRELYDVLKTSTAARAQPLEIYMTTAGFDPLSICYEVYEHAKKVRDGVVDDPSHLPVIFEPDLKDDWTQESTWKKANPNYGISVSKSYFQDQVQQALNKPSYENTFKRLHLNIWTQQDVRAIPMHKWQECGKKYPLNVDDLAGKSCWLGLDLSSKNDLTAAALLFNIKGIWTVLLKFWLPEQTMKERVVRSHVKYDLWARQGFIRVCPGGRIDYDLVRKDINELHKIYNIREIAVDPWNAYQLSTQLEKEDDFTVVHVRQGMFTLSEPTKELISLVSEVKFVHGDNPVLTWNAGNLSTEEDAAGNIKPSKKKSAEKVDGMVAIINALSRGLVAENKDSVYGERDVQVW